MLKVKQPPTYVCCGKKSYLKFAFLVFKPVDKIQLNTTFSAFFFHFLDIDFTVISIVRLVLCFVVIVWEIKSATKKMQMFFLIKATFFFLFQQS